MSLFSRTRPSVPSPPKKVRGFLGLPGELRNKIYQHCFSQELCVELAAKDSILVEQKPRHVRLSLNLVDMNGAPLQANMNEALEPPQVLRLPRRLGHYQRIQGLKTKWETSLCPLILVCKRIHAEALIFLYRSTTFAFVAPRRIREFLNVVPLFNLSQISKLHLHYETYGRTYLERDNWREVKHTKSWNTACEALSKSLTNLKELDLSIRNPDMNVTMGDLRQSWLQPVLHFRRLSRARSVPASPSCTEGLRQDGTHLKKALGSLKVVKVKFRSIWSVALTRSSNQELQEASGTLHNLFAEAISCAILGASEEVAMAGFNDAWEGKYREWHHHLNYGKTDW